ncbi:16S rRNA (cytidine(1402)-2'-O)-methyltransferase [Patescibacteria group bacterium]
MPTLYIIATPIGNLEDVNKRSLRILAEVDLILCEDTRVTRKLLSHYKVNTPTLSYHQHSKLKKVDYILELLKQGKDLALVSDAGTPGISDPGNKLVEKVFGLLDSRVNIVPVPGPSAITAAASISGFPVDKFLFFGFPPVKKKRKKFFEEIANSQYPVIFYESRYRIIKTLEELQRVANNKQQVIRVVVCRELTKKFETIYRGGIGEVIEKIKNPPSGGKIKGEFVVIVKRKY